MNSVVIISIVIFIILIISIISFIVYKKNYQIYDTELTINVKATEDQKDVNSKNESQAPKINEGTFKKTVTLTNPDTENIYATLQTVQGMKGEMKLDNPESRSIIMNVECKDNLDLYLVMNTLIDKLASLNIVTMKYSGNLFDSTIRQTYAGKFKEDNGKIILDDLSMNSMYTKEFKEYKIVDSKADSKEYIDNLEKQTQAMIDEANKEVDANGAAAGDEKKEGTDGGAAAGDEKKEGADGTAGDEKKKGADGTTGGNEKKEGVNGATDKKEESAPPSNSESFDDIGIRIKHERKSGKFIIYDNQPQMYLHIVLLNISKPESITATQKEINYPIFTYSAFKIVKEQVEIILEPYKGLISRKSDENGVLNYELHYHSNKTIENDYATILDKINKSFDVLMLKFNDVLYIYQTNDIVAIKRYIKQLESKNIKIVVDDNNLKMAQISVEPTKLLN